MINSFARRHGLPEALAGRWGARGIRQWTGLQEAAWAEGMMESGEDWLVAAPTSAGKGLLAEAVAARHVLAGERVLWLVPTRALAEAFAATLAETFSPLGLRVICATRERPESDPLLASGRFDLCVAVPEKALSWLVSQPDGLAGVGLVIADELSLLRDADRGGRFDLLLTRIMNSPYRARRIGLCLPVPNMAELAAWWGGRLLHQPDRPRPLREGVFESWSGRWRWRDRATGEESGERLVEERQWASWRDRLEDHDLAPSLIETAALAAALAARGESTILFVPTRPLARRLAEILIHVGVFKPVPAEPVRAARRLARRDPSIDHQLLARALARGIGIHHADLPAEGRRIVEEALAADRLRLAIATPTLAQGMNFSAVNVVQLPWQAGDAGGPERPLERWRFADQGGRAGRLGRGEAAGRSILVAPIPPRAEALWRRYMVEPIEPLRSRLTPDDAAAGVMLALGGNAARTAENLERELGATFAAHSGAHMSPLAEAVASCRAAGLVAETDSMRLTACGRIAAVHGLVPATVAALARWFAEPAIDAGEPLPKLLALALAAPAGLWPGRPTLPRNTLTAELAAWFESHAIEAPDALPPEANPPQLAAIEAAGRMLAWIGSEPTREVEARTGWTAGMLARAGEGLAWLARAAAALDPARGDAWDGLATRLQSGAPAGAGELASMRIEGLNRSALRLLVENGLAAPEVIAQTPLKALSRVVGDGALARRVRAAAAEHLRRSRRVGLVFPYAADFVPESGHRPDLPLIEIDLQSPGVVRVAGRELRLAPLGFDLLAALAERPGAVVTRAALYQKLWPDGGPEDQQLDAHRRRLSRALGEALGADEPIEVVRGSGFRLNCAGGVQLRRG
ncbi:MAG: DEAD/DEAH box helicase [Candidatus Sumerlaeia bacterium]